ncbi:MAG TPA: hypothetical protein VGF28_19965 [Thermoanaerobaculia bacterium]|jgi:hypothetical protein
MPQQKDLKRIVRARMQKTGESYTTARLHTVRKPALPAPPPPDYEALSGMKNAVLTEKTGRDWPQWLQVLDAFDAVNKPHRDVAQYVHSLGISGWWSQSVTVGYERIRGLRAIGQRRSGTWEANKSRTFAVPVGTLFEAFANARKRAKWLTGAKLTVKSSTKEKSMRIAFDDGTSAVFGFLPKGDAKSVVAVQHMKLPDKAAVEQSKKFWGERFEALAEVVSA